MNAVPEVHRVPSSLGYPFSSAVRVGDVWQLSGQVGLSPGTTTIVPGGVAAETRQILTSIAAMLDHLGSSIDRIIATTVYLTDIAEFDTMNEVYATFFDAYTYPARSAIGVSGLALGAHVEIECVAAAGVSVRRDG